MPSKKHSDKRKSAPRRDADRVTVIQLNGPSVSSGSTFIGTCFPEQSRSNLHLHQTGLNQLLSSLEGVISK